MEGLSGYYLNDLNRHRQKTRKAKKKNKDSGNIMNDDLISEKSDEKEPDLLSIGNRRSSLSIKNEIRNDLSESKENIKEVIEAVPEDIAAEGLSGYYLNDLNRHPPKTRKAKKKNKDSGNIMNDDLISEKSGQKEPDLLNIGSRRNSLSIQNRIGDDQSEISDLEEAGNDMEPVDGWDFAAEKLAPRTKPTFKKKLFSAAAYYGGKTIGKIGGIIANILNFMTFGVFSGINSWKALWKSTFSRKRDYQRTRNRKAIPGWDGAQFENRSKQQVDIDFRRVPDIWAYPIAEDPMDAEGKEKPPVISANISQVSKDLTVNSDEETGHSGIGIEFNRKNPRTEELERYGLRYGYYLGGGMTSLSADAVSNYNKANYPGQLRNEMKDAYSASRRFKVSARQVNAVLNASEKYPDKGYNPYTRNCTTFVRDMIVDAANIKAAAPIFEKADVHMPVSVDMKMFGAGAMAPLFKAKMENTMDKLAHRDDMNYQGFGNKVVTKEDYDRYKKSLKLFTLRPSKAHSPNASAENIRRLEGPGTGEINVFPTTIKNAEGSELNGTDKSELNQSLMGSGMYIKNLLTQITPEEDFGEGKIPADLQRIISNLERLYIPLLGLLARDKDLINISKKEIRTVRTSLSGYISDMNKLLFKYYKNDRRLHDPVLNTISTLNQLIYWLDVSWRKKSEEEVSEMDKSDKDLGDIRDKFKNGLYNFTVNEKKIIMSPSRYESFLQIYKTPKAALDKCIRYLELSDMEEWERSDAEQKEFEKLKRVWDLSESFEKFHNYMLEKEEYSQQDVDYVFSLEKKERNIEGLDDKFLQTGVFSGVGHSASDTYKMLIMQKIFGGMKNRFEAANKGERDNMQVLEWLGEDSLNCINQSPNQMKMIIRGIKRSLKDPDEKTVRGKVFDLLENWFRRSLSTLLKDRNIADIRKGLEDAGSPLCRKIESMTTSVLNEADEASLNERQGRIRN